MAGRINEQMKNNENKNRIFQINDIHLADGKEKNRKQEKRKRNTKMNQRIAIEDGNQFNLPETQPFHSIWPQN